MHWLYPHAYWEHCTSTEESRHSPSQLRCFFMGYPGLKAQTKFHLLLFYGGMAWIRASIYPLICKGYTKLIHYTRNLRACDRQFLIHCQRLLARVQKSLFITRGTKVQKHCYHICNLLPQQSVQTHCYHNCQPNTIEPANLQLLL